MKKDKLQTGDRIEVYRNLHKDCFSVRKKGIVVRHLYDNEFLHMKDVKFAVQPAGHARVIREGRKNVHAFVRGTYHEPAQANWQAIAKYNPYKHDYFFTSFGGNDTPIYTAREATLSGGNVYVN